MAETGAKSKIPGMSRKKWGCGGEVVSVVTAAALLGSACKTREHRLCHSHAEEGAQSQGQGV